MSSQPPSLPLQVALLAWDFEARGRSLYTLRLAEHLPEHDIQQQIVCCSAQGVPAERRTKLGVAEFPQLDWPIWQYIAQRELLAHLRARGTQLIHAQTPRLLTLGQWLANRLRVPLVVTVHDFLGKGEWLPFRPRYGGRIIAVSHPVKADLVQRTRLSGDLVRVIQSGVEHPLANQVPGETAVVPPSDKHLPVVGTAGPLETLKGQAYLLQAAKSVLARHPRTMFLIAGRGPEETNLRRMARELELTERVTFVSSMQDYYYALDAMDIFCLPSVQQGLGTVMLEAMARQKPVIATRVGGVLSIVRDHENGLVIPSRDHQALAEAICELLDHPELALKLARSGRQLVEKEFAIGPMVTETAAIYRKLCLKARPAAAPAGSQAH